MIQRFVKTAASVFARVEGEGLRGRKQSQDVPVEQSGYKALRAPTLLWSFLLWACFFDFPSLKEEKNLKPS